MAKAKAAKTVQLIPTWKAAANIYIMALENGTAEGKAAGRAGIHEMAEHLDKINADNSDTDEG